MAALNYWVIIVIVIVVVVVIAIVAIVVVVCRIAWNNSIILRLIVIGSVR